MTHLQIVNHQQNLPPFEKKITYKSNRTGLVDRFDGKSTQVSVALDIEQLAHYDDQLRRLELYLEQSANVDDPQAFFRLQTIPGVGRIIAMIGGVSVFYTEQTTRDGTINHTNTRSLFCRKLHCVANRNITGSFGQDLPAANEVSQSL